MVYCAGVLKTLVSNQREKFRSEGSRRGSLVTFGTAKLLPQTQLFVERLAALRDSLYQRLPAAEAQ